MTRRKTKIPMARRKAQAAMLNAALSGEEFVKEAKRVLWDSLASTQIRSIQVDRLAQVEAHRLDKLFGRGHWVQHGGKIIFLAPNEEVRLSAAKEIMARAEPALKSADHAAIGSYRVQIKDPNSGQSAEADLVIEASEGSEPSEASRVEKVLNAEGAGLQPTEDRPRRETHGVATGDGD